jgi:uncharacterized protein (DUF697 family)
VTEKHEIEKQQTDKQQADKQQSALKTVRTYMWWSMGAGLIPVPFADLAAVTGVQLKMLNEISKLYGIAFQENRGKAVVGSLIGSIVPGTLAFGALGSALKAVPVIGTFAGAPAMVLFCGASTWALGKVFIQHFESGGTFLDFDPDEVREYYKAQFDESRKALETDKKAKVPA